MEMTLGINRIKGTVKRSQSTKLLYAQNFSNVNCAATAFMVCVCVCVCGGGGGRVIQLSRNMESVFKLQIPSNHLARQLDNCPHHTTQSLRLS